MASEAPKIAKGLKVRKGRKKLNRTVIEHMDDGKGHTVSHEYKRKMQDSVGSFPQHEEEKHAFATTEEMMDHLHSKFGGKAKAAPKEEAEEEPEEESDEEES